MGLIRIVLLVLGISVLLLSAVLTRSQSHIQYVLIAGDDGFYLIPDDGSPYQALLQDEQRHHVSWSLDNYVTAAPDGSWLFFTAGERQRDAQNLYQIRPDGQSVTRLTDFPDWNILFSPEQFVGDPLTPHSSDWSPDGKWLIFDHAPYASFYEVDTYRIGSNGQGLLNLTNQVANASEFAGWSADSDWLLHVPFWDMNRSWEIYRVGLDGSGTQPITSEQTQHEIPLGVSPDGEWLVFMEDQQDNPQDTLYKVRLDGTDLQTIPVAPPEAGDVTISFETWSQAGSTLVINLEISAEQYAYDLYALDLKAETTTRLTHSPEVEEAFVAWLPDGVWMLYQSEGRLYRVNRLTGESQRLTPAQAESSFMTWTPDEQGFLFASNAEGQWDIYQAQADGSHLKNLTPDNDYEFADLAGFYRWSPDGANLFVMTYSDPANHLHHIRLDGQPTEQWPVEINPPYLYPQVTQDGNWMFLIDWENEAYQLYKIHLNTGGLTPVTALPKEPYHMTIFPNINMEWRSGRMYGVSGVLCVTTLLMALGRNSLNKINKTRVK